jgi:hypothetical protein
MPQLVPLYEAFVGRDDFPAAREPAQAVRRFLASHGLGRRVWRLVCRSSPRLLLPVRDFYRGSVDQAVLDYLRILAALGVDHEPPAGLMWDILSRYGNPDARYWSYLCEVDRRRDWISHVARSFTALSAKRQPLERDRLDGVLQWCETCRPAIDKPRRRAGWEWLTRRAQDWLDMKQAEIGAAARRWKPPFDAMSIGRFEMRPVSSVAELWEEARSMHHCADAFVDACARGDTIIVSVRDRGTARRVATARLEHEEGTWRCRQVRGFANRDPDPRVGPAVDRLSKGLGRVA